MNIPILYGILWILISFVVACFGFLHFSQWMMFLNIRKQIKYFNSIIGSLEDPKFKKSMDDFSHRDDYQEKIKEIFLSSVSEEKKVILEKMGNKINLSKILDFLVKPAVNSFQDYLLEIERMSDFDLSFLWTQKHRDELRKVKEEVRIIRIYFNSLKND